MKVFLFLLASTLHHSLGSQGFISTIEFDRPHHAIRELTQTFNCNRTYDCCMEGTSACESIGENGGITTVEKDSCSGENSCSRLGSCHAGGTCRATVDVGSCNGEESCRQVGESTQNQTAEADIGKEACQSIEACKQAGNRGKAIIGDKSCIGDYSCQFIGSLEGDYEGDYVSGSGTYVGKNSCRESYACSWAGSTRTLGADIVPPLIKVEIANDSCNAVQACYAIGYNGYDNNIDEPHNIKIGSHSCNCIHCCSCLTGNITVPDNSCNSKGTHANQCCKENNDVNDDYDPYTLPVYNVSAPNCYTNTSGAAAVVNINCDYQITLPSGLNDTAVASFIRDYSQCITDNNNVNNTENVTLTSELTGENNETYEVVIQVIPDSTTSTAEVKFCLFSEVRDRELHAMKYHGQLIDMTFDYTTKFDLNFTSAPFNGFNKTTPNLGTVVFDVSVYRCDIGKTRLVAAVADVRLTIEDPLYVCIDSKTDDIVVKKITKFILKKDDIVGYNAVDNGDNDSNTFVKDKGKRVVQVGTRPQALLFKDNKNIIIQGSALLGPATSSDRYLARFAQEISDDTATTGDFEMQLEVVKAVSAADTVASGITLTLYGTMIGIFVASVLF